MNPRFMLLDEPFAGIDPIAVTGNPEDHLPPEGAGHRHPHHRPQRAADAEDYRPCIYRHGWGDLSQRHPRRAGRRRRSSADLPRDRFPAGLRLEEADGDPAKASDEARAEADPYPVAPAGDQTAADVDVGVGRPPQPGGRREPSARRGADRGSGRAGADARRKRRRTRTRPRTRPIRGTTRTTSTSSAIISTTATARARRRKSKSCRRSRTRSRPARRSPITSSGSCRCRPPTDRHPRDWRSHHRQPR